MLAHGGDLYMIKACRRIDSGACNARDIFAVNRDMILIVTKSVLDLVHKHSLITTPTHPKVLPPPIGPLNLPWFVVSTLAPSALRSTPASSLSPQGGDCRAASSSAILQDTSSFQYASWLLVHSADSGVDRIALRTAIAGPLQA